MEQAIPLPTVSTECAEKQQLIDQIKRAVGEIVLIHSQEIEAVLKGDLTEDATFQERLRTAHKQKDLLIEKLGSHMLAHGC
jgi:hypothetical protein